MRSVLSQDYAIDCLIYHSKIKGFREGFVDSYMKSYVNRFIDSYMNGEIAQADAVIDLNAVRLKAVEKCAKYTDEDIIARCKED